MTERTADSIADEILALAATHFRLQPGQLGADDDLFERLGLNSLQALELISRLEAAFGIELPDYELQNVTTIRTLAERVRRRL